MTWQREIPELRRAGAAAASGWLAGAVLATEYGDCTIPRELLGRLIQWVAEPPDAVSRTVPLRHPARGSELTGRELDVLQLIADGYGNADIAELLACSQHTVKNIIYDLMGRLQLRNRAHAAAYAVRAGLV